MHHADDAAWDIAITSHAVQTLRCVAAGLAFVWHHLGRTTPVGTPASPFLMLLSWR